MSLPSSRNQGLNKLKKNKLSHYYNLKIETTNIFVQRPNNLFNEFYYQKHFQDQRRNCFILPKQLNLRSAEDNAILSFSDNIICMILVMPQKCLKHKINTLIQHQILT